MEADMTTRSDTEGLLREALALADAMIRSGERHSPQTIETFRNALSATPPDTDPSGLDVEAAWEALRTACRMLDGHPLDGNMDAAFARHRPIIEAAIHESRAGGGLAGLDAQILGMAMDLVDEEDARLGVVNRGRKAERVAAEYARLSGRTSRPEGGLEWLQRQVDSAYAKDTGA